VAWEEENERHTGPFGDAALAAAAPAAGERVLDVGCGCGSATVALGNAVGPAGQVLGIDLSAAMLARAEQRAKAAGLGHVTFRRADAQTGDLRPGSQDLVFSRFGVMFFADPPAAFARLRRALRPGGRIAFACWQVPSANPWMALPNRAAIRFFGLAPPPHDAPGPFSLADPDRTSAVLGAAGFTSVSIRPHRRTLRLGVGQSVAEWVHRRLLIGPASRTWPAIPAGSAWPARP
jgi:SAM-dependent methyltransferase